MKIWDSLDLDISRDKDMDKVWKNPHTDDMNWRFYPRVPNETVEYRLENEINPEQNQSYTYETHVHLKICERTDYERTWYVKMARHSEILDENVN